MLIEPARLLGAWPTLIGRHVALDAFIERAVDFSEVIISHARSQFSVLMARTDSWTGRHGEAASEDDRARLGEENHDRPEATGRRRTVNP